MPLVFPTTKNNYAATVAPTVTDDAAAGYIAGSLWIVPTTGLAWRCRDATASAAKWMLMGLADHPGYVAGNWYFPAGYALNAGAVQGSTLARGSLLVIKERITISDLGCRVTTQGAGNVQLALYNANQTTLHPTTLLSNTASITTASTGVVTAALGSNQQIEPGFYWLFGQLDSTASGNAVVLQSLSGGTPVLGSLLGEPTAATLDNANATGMVGISITNTFGSWGDFTGATVTSVGGSATPSILFKVTSTP